MDLRFLGDRISRLDTGLYVGSERARVKDYFWISGSGN